jgi:outer membrane lipoprotein-sorting protein
MKRIPALILLLALSVATASAQIFTGPNSARQAQKAGEKQQKAQNKAARKQQKAIAKSQKAQRRAAKRAQRHG